MTLDGKKLFAFLGIMILFLSMTVNSGHAYFSTPVITGQMSVNGTVVANLGASTQYPYNAPATDTAPLFYSAVETHGLSDYGVDHLRITISITDPNGNFLPGVGIKSSLAALHSPEDSGTAQSLLQQIYNVLVSVVPYGIASGVTNGAPNVGGLTTDADSSSAWADYSPTTFSILPPDGGLQAAYRLPIDPTLQGTYVVHILYFAQHEAHTSCCSGPWVYYTAYDTVLYCYVKCHGLDVSANPTLLKPQAGTTATSTITLTSYGDFSGTVTLMNNVVPSGLSLSLNPTSVWLGPGATAQATLTAITYTNTAQQDYSVDVIASSGSIIQHLFFLVHVIVGPPPPNPSYVFPATFTQGGVSGSQITVCAGTSVSVKITLSATTTFSGPVDVQVRRDIVFYPDDTLTTLSKTVTLNSGNNAINMGSFTASDLTSGSIGGVRQYYIKVVWYDPSARVIYDPTDPNTREWVQTKFCSTSSGGGSVAAGTLITTADGSKIPVQHVRVGDELLAYDLFTGKQIAAVVTSVKVVTVNNKLTIYTASGLPFRTDYNPRFRLHILVDGQVVLKPVTEIQAGDLLFNYDETAWVPVTGVSVEFGGIHTVYDITIDPRMDFIANGYADCPCKL